MAFRIVTVPFDRARACFLEEELNRFCADKTVISYHAALFQEAGSSYWSVLLEYEAVVDGRGGAPAKEQLSRREELLYRRIREWRTERANRDGVPVFVILTNDQALDLVKRMPRSVEELKAVKGFGKKRIEHFGTARSRSSSARSSSTPTQRAGAREPTEPYGGRSCSYAPTASTSRRT